MRTSYSEGFTIIEVTVTLAVVSLFAIYFFQLYLVSESQRLAVLQQATASDLAYSNLRKFATKPLNLSCTASMDLSLDANAPGTEISNATYLFTPEPTPAILGSTATQTVTAYSTSSCANYSSNPLKIISSVSYGTNNQRVIHAAYVN